MLFIRSLTQGKRRNYTVRSYSNHADKEIPEDFLGTNVETQLNDNIKCTLGSRVIEIQHMAYRMVFNSVEHCFTSGT